MNDDQLLRYARHILLEDVGIEGQERLRAKHALIVGVGGLGSPAAIYLAASGVGRMTLVDDDIVDVTNLQRQILFGTPDVGMPKASTGRAALARLNPDVAIECVASRADDALLAALVAQADVVLDCSDNFATRHAVNRACVASSVPLVSGAAVGFDGQLASFVVRQADGAATSACYACLFPETGEVDAVDCATFGVFSPLTGIIGAMQAAEAVKLLMGLPTDAGRLLLLDARAMAWQVVRFGHDSACRVCGERTERSDDATSRPRASML